MDDHSGAVHGHLFMDRSKRRIRDAGEKTSRPITLVLLARQTIGSASVFL